MVVTLYVAVTLVALMIIGLVLIQQSKGGGLGGAFGGGGDSVFGAQAGNHLTKMTVILISVFFVLVLVLLFFILRNIGFVEIYDNLITSDPLYLLLASRDIEDLSSLILPPFSTSRIIVSPSIAAILP